MSTLQELLGEDTIDVEALTDRFEEIEDSEEPEEKEEFATLGKILSELEGGGGDHKWRGNWYPATLIHENYFTEYIQEMLADCGTIPTDLPDYVVLDWDATAENCRVDYTESDFQGFTYLYR